MGKEKYLREVEALFAKSPVVTYSSIEKIITHKKKVKRYVKRLVHYLLTSGRIKRLTKGCYTAMDDAALAVFCFQPAYLGLHDALSFHNLWEQETAPVIITAKKVRPGLRSVLGSNALIKRIGRKYLFGIEYHQEGKIAIPYSDVQKTFIDMVYFNEKISKELLNAFRKRLNYKKLKACLKLYPQRLRKRVMAHL